MSNPRVIAALVVLLVFTAVAFTPVFRAQFLSWDDEIYVPRNKLLRDVGGLKEIWNPQSTYLDQYYPLVFTSYWLEYRFWGANPAGYHVTNLALHLVNVVLVFLVAARLGAAPWVAVGTAGIFALHPMQVASVAWVAERKNTLSGLFYLTSFLLYLPHRRTGQWMYYWGCLAAFVAVLLSKTQMMTLPVSIFAAEVLGLVRDRSVLLRSRPELLRASRQGAKRAKGRTPLNPPLPRGEIGGWGFALRGSELRGVLARLAPMLVLAFLAVQTTVRFESRVAPPLHRLPDASERFVAAPNAPWFYAAKFLLPVGVSPMYRKWDVSAAEPKWWLGIAAWPIAAALLWRFRECIGAHTLWGIAHFVIVLTPVLGFVVFNYLQYTFVANHFVYLAVIGGGLAVATTGEALAIRRPRMRAPLLAAAVFVMSFLSVQTYREAQQYTNTSIFWLHVIERNPSSFPANYSLGEYHRFRSSWDSALPYYAKALAIRPDSPGAFTWYIAALLHLQGPHRALEACNAALEQGQLPNLARFERGKIYARTGRSQEALRDFESVWRSEPQGSALRKFAEDEWRRVQASMGKR
jgi:hypothetical protein